MTPKFGTVYDIFMMSEYVLRQLHDSTWYGEVKNVKTVWRKRILVTQYIYVYTPCTEDISAYT